MTPRPEYIFGTAGLHRIAWRPARRRLLKIAFDAGFRSFDTAPMYGDGLGELEIGQAFSRDRSQIKLTTKFGFPAGTYGAARPWTFVAERAARMILNRRAYRAAFALRDWSVAQMRRDLEASLKRLDTDRVDRFCLHEPLDIIPIGLWDDLCAEASTLKQQGKIGAFGLSGQQPCTAELARRPGLDFVQTHAGNLASVAAFQVPIFAYGLYGQFRASGHRDFTAYLRDGAAGRADAYLLSSTKPAAVAAYAALFG